MSRSLQHLKFRMQRRNKEGLLYSKEIRAFDTENPSGQPAKVLCSDQEPRVISSLDDALKFLTKYKFSSSLNVFWNMDYDISSILKYEPDVMKELFTEQEAEYDKYKLTYIDEKKFVIRTGKHKYSYYDVQQYFKDRTPSLAGAAKVYLGKQADELKGDRAKLFELYPIPRIAQYCISDCQLTKELTQYLVDGVGSIGFWAPDLMSVGSLSRKYCNQFSNIPLLNYMQDLEIVDAYYQAYRGGWFEIQKRGIMEAWGYDIISAYPTITRELPDIRSGIFEEIEDLSDIEKTDEYGVLLLSCSSKQALTVNPLSTEIGIQLFYPVLDIPEYKFITLREYRAFKEFYNFELIKGWIFRPFFNNYERPFQAVIDKLYNIKETEKLAGRKNSAMYITSKLIMNSIYGNTIQTTDTKEGRITGSFFNPFYAAEITAFCRCTVWEAIKDQLDDVIMIATDGIYTDRPLKNVKLGFGLGDWEMEHEGETAVFHSSGVYQFRGEESKGRGIGRQHFFNLFNKNRDYTYVRLQHRKKVKECIAHDRIGDVNKYVKQWKRLSLDGDIRRDWLTEPETFRDLLNNKYESRALHTAILQEVFKDKCKPSAVPWEPGTWKNEFKYL